MTILNDRLGTVWVAPGEGATVQEISDAIRASYGIALGGGLDAAWPRLVDLGLKHVTNLALKGTPLSAYDLKRIAVCD